jgi:hypothetical protein
VVDQLEAVLAATVVASDMQVSVALRTRCFDSSCSEFGIQPRWRWIHCLRQSWWLLTCKSVLLYADSSCS